MVTETREIYKCDHCRKFYQIKSACKKHEVKCKKNPENYKICHSCSHLDKVDVEVNFQDHNGDDNFYLKKILHCSKLNTYLYPLSIENSQKGGYLQEDIGNGEIENNPMPKKCNELKLWN